MPVARIEERIVHFYLETVLDNEWRHLGSGRWIPDSHMTDDQREHAPGHMVFDDQILGDMVDEIIGESNGLVETQTGSGTFDVTINLDECKYTSDSLHEAMIAIVEHFDKGKVESGGEPYVHNQGTSDYYDPKTMYPKFIAPKSAHKALKKKA